MQLVLLCLKVEKLMDSTLPFPIQKNSCHKILLVGHSTVVAFKNIHFLCLLVFICIKKNDKWM